MSGFVRSLIHSSNRGTKERRRAHMTRPFLWRMFGTVVPPSTGAAAAVNAAFPVDAAAADAAISVAAAVTASAEAV